MTKSRDHFLDGPMLVEQIKAARMLLDWDQSKLAFHARVGISTIKRLESRPGKLRGAAETAWRIKEALEKAGIIFIDSVEMAGPGVRLMTPKRGRAG